MVKRTFLLFVNLIAVTTISKASAIRVWSGSITVRVSDSICFVIGIFACLCLAAAITKQLEVTTTTNLFSIFFYLLFGMLP